MNRLLGLFTCDKAFYKLFFPLLFIVTLQQLAALTVNMVDNIMLGKYTELALSGATLVSRMVELIIVVYVLFIDKKVHSYAKTMQIIFLCIGVIFGGLMFLLKDPIIGIYSVSEETKLLASKFLTVLSITTIGTCYEYPVHIFFISKVRLAVAMKFFGFT